MVNVDEMLFGFVPGRGTTGAIFVVRQLQEKYISANKLLYFAFVEHEKAFDRVPSRACTSVPGAVCGSIVSTVRSLAWELGIIKVLSLAQCSSLVCHGSFSTLITWCSSRTSRRSASLSSRRGRLGWKVKGSVSTWRRPSAWSSVLAMMSSRNLASIPVLFNVVVLATTPSRAHSAWVHKEYSGIAKRLVANRIYVCPTYSGKDRPIDGRTVNEVDVDGTMLDVEATFCYLGDMLCCGGDCDSATAARCCMAWGKLRELLPVLTTRHQSPRMHGNVYETCFCAWLCSTVTKRGDQITPNCSGSTAMTMPWSAGSVASQTEMKHPQLHYYRNLALRILRRSFAAGDSD